jgi:hypothetical protein
MLASNETNQTTKPPIKRFCGPTISTTTRFSFPFLFLRGWRHSVSVTTAGEKRKWIIARRSQCIRRCSLTRRRRPRTRRLARSLSLARSEEEEGGGGEVRAMSATDTTAARQRRPAPPRLTAALHVRAAVLHGAPPLQRARAPSRCMCGCCSQAAAVEPRRR